MAEVDNIHVGGEESEASSEKPEEPAWFSKPDETTDIVFVVEEKHIHFNKTLLSMSSPVFKRMLFGDFAEKNAKEIPLPGKRYSDVVAFFKQIHPASVLQVTDDTLLGLLELSREYQVESVRSKCQQYLQYMTTKAERDDHAGLDRTMMDRMLLYIYICGEYDFKKLLPRLASLVAKKPINEITGCDTYKSKPSLAYLGILQSRCADLENTLSSREIVLREVRGLACQVSDAEKHIIFNFRTCGCDRRKRDCCTECVAMFLKQILSEINERTSRFTL